MNLKNIKINDKVETLPQSAVQTAHSKMSQEQGQGRQGKVLSATLRVADKTLFFAKLKFLQPLNNSLRNLLEKLDIYFIIQGYNKIYHGVVHH